jgi:hypothetical protein
MGKRALLFASALRTSHYPARPSGVHAPVGAVQPGLDCRRADTEVGFAAATFSSAFFNLPTIHFLHDDTPPFIIYCLTCCVEEILTKEQTCVKFFRY